MAKKVIQVDFRKSASSKMADLAKLPRTLMGGTFAMRAAKTTYLPQEAKESDLAYSSRVERTTLFNAFGKAVTALTGKLFSKDISLEEGVPDSIREWCEDVDLQGRNLNRFVRDVVFDAMQAGLGHIVIDMPPLPVDAEGNPRTVLTVEEEKQMGRRPYLSHYKMEDALNWRVKDGKLVMMVFQESVTEEDGEWGEIEVTQIRVLRPGSWEIYRQDEKTKNWALHDTGKTTLDFIPLVTIYTNRKGYMVAEPLLLDLAHLNVAHWQSSSDQRHILHVARVPILFGTGWDEETTALGNAEIGPNTIQLQPVGATMEYVEHTGSAIGAGKADLDDLEARMAIMAMEPLTQKSGSVTATAKAIDTAEAHSCMQDLANHLKDAVENIMVTMGAWVKLPAERCGEAKVFADFSLNMGDPSVLTALKDARTMGDISREAYLDELQRHNVLKADYDIGEDKDLLDQESAALAEMVNQNNIGGANDQTQQ